MDPLLDKEFLKKLDESKNHIVYAKIIALTFDESPIEEVTGSITQGSINIDGSSAVRRTCSLIMVAKDINIDNYYWGLNTKFKLFVGLENHIDDKYPEIIWFKQGIYLITSFSASVGTNNFTINIQGKDKMCLLNGDVGGLVTACSVDFGKIDEYDETTDTYNKIDYEIQDIIREAVHEYAREPYHNIIINDVAMSGYELVEYKGDDPIYFAINNESNEVVNMYVDGNVKYYTETGEEIALNSPALIYDNRIEMDLGLASTANKPRVVYDENHDPYVISKIEYGMTCGYRTTNLTYPGDLIGKAGESITSCVLDKIKNMLGDYEYFYDLDGRFVFQRKRTYTKTSWNNIINKGVIMYIENNAYANKYSYNFENGTLISAYNNSPNLLNLKNDFSIWGIRKTENGSEIPIHFRYAIHKKPTLYKAYNGKTYTVLSNLLISNKVVCDWREIIYQMAADYLKHNHDDDFITTIIQNNPTEYPTGYTGYENYYTDILGFWRDIYNPEPEKITEPDDFHYYYYYWDYERQEYKAIENSEIAVVKNKSDIPVNTTIYVTDSINSTSRYRKATDQDFTSDDKFYTRNKEYFTRENSKMKRFNIYKLKPEYLSWSFYETPSYNISNGGWSMNINNPELLNFWIDFLDTDGDIGRYAVPLMGDRPKTVDDSNIKAIYFRDTPNVIFKKPEEERTSTGYTYVNLSPNLEQLFAISAQKKSAFDQLGEFLHDFAYCTESISITTIPIYYLEPNTLISVYDKNSKINGDYIIDKISIPLSYNGMMSISATKTIESIY